MGESRTSITEIVQASHRGDVITVGQWLAAGGNPNQLDAQGWTPLLAACAHGHADLVRVLLDADIAAEPDLPFLTSGALPIHLAGQSGNIVVAELLLAKRPDHLDRVWLLNGHTLLLQAVFYGHVDLTRWALDRGANTAATTVRGLAAMELASQFENEALIEVIRPHDSPAAAKEWHLQILLGRIAAFVPYEQRETQARLDQLIDTIGSMLRPAAGSTPDIEPDMASIRNLLDDADMDLNGLGGPLQQPPLVVAVTGNDGHPPNPDISALRRAIVCELLDRGADPTLCERHPMAVDTIIRAAVFGHLEILEEIAARIGTQRMAAALNAQPAVNGLTALHDAVLRASTAGTEHLDRYLSQIGWFTSIGARSDIEDFAGRTQASIARAVSDPARRTRILDALGLGE